MPASALADAKRRDVAQDGLRDVGGRSTGSLPSQRTRISLISGSWSAVTIQKPIAFVLPTSVDGSSLSPSPAWSRAGGGRPVRWSATSLSLQAWRPVSRRRSLPRTQRWVPGSWLRGPAIALLMVEMLSRTHHDIGSRPPGRLLRRRPAPTPA